jgi:hypothetical protein
MTERGLLKSHLQVDDSANYYEWVQNPIDGEK